MNKGNLSGWRKWNAFLYVFCMFALMHVNFVHIWIKFFVCVHLHNERNHKESYYWPIFRPSFNSNVGFYQILLLRFVQSFVASCTVFFKCGFSQPMDELSFQNKCILFDALEMKWNEMKNTNMNLATGVVFMLFTFFPIFDTVMQ